MPPRKPGEHRWHPSMYAGGGIEYTCEFCQKEQWLSDNHGGVLEVGNCPKAPKPTVEFSEKQLRKFCVNILCDREYLEYEISKLFPKDEQK